MTLFTKAFEDKMMDFYKFVRLWITGLVFMLVQTFLGLLAMKLEEMWFFIEDRKNFVYTTIILLLILRLVIN